MSKRVVGWLGIGVLVAWYLVHATNSAYAETLQSPNYRFDESTVGAGGLIQSNSANFQAANSGGDIAVGDASSANYNVSTGSNTTPDPTLSFAITSSAPAFNSFSPSAASTATATFSVLNYTSYGYVVQLVGTPPTNGAHIISPLASASASTPGTEQFGINLVANTSPTSVGANPDNGQFGFGTAAANYNTSNQYRFVSGDTIASAPKSSGTTNYTISYLVNVNSLTPGGNYTSNQTLVVTGTY
jgi:hypothetical protein